jgi:hypothetical protein
MQRETREMKERIAFFGEETEGMEKEEEGRGKREDRCS